MLGLLGWDSFIFRVLCSELDVHLYSWGIWIPSPIFDMPGPRAVIHFLIPRVLGLTQKWLPYSFLECWAHNWVPSSLLGNLGQDLGLPSPLIFLFLVGVPNL